MTPETQNAAADVHWSFWVIGAVGLLFNLLGCMNYISQMSTESVASMPDVYRSMIESRPAWGTAAFAVAVFGGAVACLLLLLRKAIAFYVFIIALAGTVAAQIPYLGMSDLPTEAWFGWLSQLVVGTFLVWYSKRSMTKGRIG